MSDTSVIIARSSYQGNPVLEGQTAGNLIKVLKAYLVDGWNQTEILSCTFDSGTGEAVLAFSAEHYFEAGQVINVTGITPSDYNGRWRVSSRTTNDLRFTPATVPSSDGADAGSGMYCQQAPAGWTMPHVDTGETKAIFENVNGVKYLVENEEAVSGGYDNATEDESAYLYVDGTNYYQAVRIQAVTNVVDLSTYDLLTQQDTGVAKGGFAIGVVWSTWAFNVGDEMQHDVFADGQGFHVFIQHGNGGLRGTYAWHYFGQLYEPGQVGRAVMTGVQYNSVDAISGLSQASNLTHLGGSYTDDNRIENNGLNNNVGIGFYSGYGTTGRGPYNFPTPDNEFLFDDKVRGISEGNFCGYLPGVAAVLHPAPLTDGTRFVGPNGVTWEAVSCAEAGTGVMTNAVEAQLLINVSHSWRG